MATTTITRIALSVYPQGEDCWPALTAPALRWLVQELRLPIPPHHVPLLLRGGELEGEGMAIRTAAAADQADATRLWALTCTWGAADPRHGRLRADLGLERRDDHWRLSLALRHGLPPAYVGPPLPPPPSRLHSLVSDLLRDPRWRVDGVARYPLSDRPWELQPGQGRALAAALADPQRRYPLVYLSRGAGGRPPLDPAALARALAGGAVVAVAQTPELDRELDRLLPPGLACVRGGARLYLPAAPGDDQAPSYQLTSETLAAMGAAAPEYLAAAVARWAEGAFAGWLTTPEQLGERMREAERAELRAKELAEASALHEYTRLLEEENGALQSQVRALSEQYDRLRAEIAELEDLKARLGHLTRGYDQLRQRAAEEEQSARQQSVIATLRELPESLPELLDLVARLFPGRVVVTERAYKSAERAALERANDGRLGWRILHALATTLYDLIFAEQPATDVQAAFQQQTGIEVAFSETKHTNRNNRLMALRCGLDDRGRPIDLTPHLKLGDRPPRQLRVHFAIDRERRLLIIGHCGDHLETFGTRRIA